MYCTALECPADQHEVQFSFENQSPGLFKWEDLLLLFFSFYMFHTFYIFKYRLVVRTKLAILSRLLWLWEVMIKIFHTGTFKPKYVAKDLFHHTLAPSLHVLNFFFLFFFFSYMF